MVSKLITEELDNNECLIMIGNILEMIQIHNFESVAHVGKKQLELPGTVFQVVRDLATILGMRILLLGQAITAMRPHGNISNSL